MRKPRFGGSVSAFNTFLTDQMVSRDASEVYGADLPTFARSVQAAYPDLDINVLDNLDEMVIRGVEADIATGVCLSVSAEGVRLVDDGIQRHD